MLRKCRTISILSLIIFIASCSQKPSLSSDEYLKLIGVATCYHISQSTDGSKLWLPEIIVKFAPKIPFNSVALKGTFIDMKDNSALGKDEEDSINDLEPGIVYTLKINSSQGWVTGSYDWKVKINPHMDFDNDTSNLHLTMALDPVSSINNSECQE